MTLRKSQARQLAQRHSAETVFNMSVFLFLVGRFAIAAGHASYTNKNEKAKTELEAG